jgi:predicted nuclease of restriction endonuclease-like (RecB) superfamily
VAEPLVLRPTLLKDVRSLILQAREGVARAVDSSLSMLYWQIGHRIRQDILKRKRADYGAQVVAAVGKRLEREFGDGFAEKNLRRMIQFAEVFSDSSIVVSLIRQLSWTHFIALIPIDDAMKRSFYAELCRVEGWSVRTLRQKIAGMLYERTALSRKPAKLIKAELKQLREKGAYSPDLVFRDPYMLGFLHLKDAYAEKDPEAAILREMESFILELGVGFCFVARQRRMIIDGRDYYLDLLFYHRKLRRLVAIDLKLDSFEAADKGQMELCLAWLRGHACEADEAEPLGMILCAGKSEEHIALLQLKKSGIHVASYWTDALPKKDLERKLGEAVQLARKRLETGDGTARTPKRIVA